MRQVTSDTMRFQLMRTHRGHQDTICALAAVPGQPKVLSAACDGTLKEWDLRRDTYELIQNASDPYITALDVFPAGYFFATGDSQGQLKLWNLETGEIVRLLEGHTARINAVAITHDGRRLISGSEDRTLRIWNALTGEIQQVCSEHETGLAALALTPNDQQVLAAEMGSPEFPARIKIWQVDTGTLDRVFLPAEPGHQAMVVLRDGQQVVSTSATGEIIIWNRESGATIHHIHPSFGPVITALLPDESHIIVGTQIPSLSLWSLDTGKNMYLFEEPPSPVTCLTITPDSRAVIAGCQDGSLSIYMRVS